VRTSELEEAPRTKMRESVTTFFHVSYPKAVALGLIIAKNISK